MGPFYYGFTDTQTYLDTEYVTIYQYGTGCTIGFYQQNILYFVLESMARSKNWAGHYTWYLVLLYRYYVYTYTHAEV